MLTYLRNMLTPSSNVVPDDIAQSIDEWIKDGAKPIESSIPNLLGVTGCGISDLRKSPQIDDSTNRN